MNPISVGAILGALVILEFFAILMMAGRVVEQRKLNQLNAAAIVTGNQQLATLREQMQKMETPVIVHIPTEQALLMADRIAGVVVPMIKSKATGELN